MLIIQILIIVVAVFIMILLVNFAAAKMLSRSYSKEQLNEC